MKINSLLMLGATAFAAAGFAAPKGEVVYSCDFENLSFETNGLPKGWYVDKWGDKKVEWTTDVGYGGKGKALLVNVKGIAGGALQFFTGPWEQWQGKWYRLTFKAKGYDHPGRVSLMPRKYFYPWSMLAWSSVSFHPENEWKEYSCVKLAQHDIARDFGVMISTGDIGSFLIDDIKVEKFDENPEPPKVLNTNKPVKGNLIPRGNFETEHDPFFFTKLFSNGVWPQWYEPSYSRVEGGRDGGRYCLRFGDMPKIPDEPGVEPRRVVDASFMSARIPLASGHRYKLSGWYRTKGGHFSMCVTDGNNKWFCSAGSCFIEQNSIRLNRHPFPGEWWHFESKPSDPVPDNITSAFFKLELLGDAVELDGIDFRLADDDTPDKPYELQLSTGKDPRRHPKITKWGEKVPLVLAAMPKTTNVVCGAVKATLRAIAYPDRVTAEETVVLKGGEELKYDFDPKANGILRLELVPQDAAQAEPIENVIARLPEPRKTGVESHFGTHMRCTPAIIDYGAAIGMKWQRLHDCSNICKGRWGNPGPDKYAWADEIVDYIRAKGLNILALPDYPRPWMNQYKGDEYDDWYAKWCGELVKHYKGRISHFELWNEPYIPGFYKGTPEAFGRRWLKAARAVRKANPDAKVVGWCTELSSPQFASPFLKDIPVAEKPDIHSVHFYWAQVPGDGVISYSRLLDNVRTTFGDRFADSGEIWNTEGNMAIWNSFYDRYRKVDRQQNDKAVAFGTRGWSETIASGVDKVFLYTMHNTDEVDVGGLMSLIDFNRSPNPEAAATATTAYFIDGLKPVKDLAAIPGVKYNCFAGDGRVTFVVWKDILVRGSPALSVGGKLKVFDAMGNALAGEQKLAFIPLFVTADGLDAKAAAAELAKGIR